MERRPVSPVDAAWLRMDSPENPMVITVVLRFADVLPEPALEETFARLLDHRRFRQRVVRDRRSLTRWSWEDDPSFELSRHVTRLPLPIRAGQGPEDALEAFVSDSMTALLVPDRPLWRVHVVDIPAGGSAFVVRVHHAVGDGIALVRTLLGVAGGGDDARPVRVGVAGDAPARTALDFARTQTGRARTLARMLLLPEDARTPLRGPLGTKKVSAWSRGIPLATVKEIARAHGGHVNDVVAAAVAGALRATLGTGAPAVRALVPVFLRSEDGDSTANHFGLAYLALPTDLDTPAARVAATRQAMAEIKSAPDATVAFLVLGAMGLASPTLERFGIDLFTRKATLLVTNVPGPAAKVRLAGQEVESMVVWAPTSGNVGLGFSILSYAGEVRVGVAADRGRVAEPQALVRAFEAEIDALSRGP